MSETNVGPVVTPKPDCELVAGCKKYEALQSDLEAWKRLAMAHEDKMTMWDEPNEPKEIVEARAELKGRGLM